MRTRPIVPALLAALVLLVGACADDDAGGGDASPTSGAADASTTTTIAPEPTATAGCDADAPTEPGTEDRTTTIGGVAREYLLQVPPSYDGTEPYPVVLGLHALTVDYHVIPGMSGFGDMEGTYDFIGVAPSGRRDAAIDDTPFWNAAPEADNYDVAFIAELLDELGDELCLDPARVFSTGMSNGAQMSSLLACRLSDRIAAIAPVSGVEFLEPCDGEPVPIVAFHGSADPILPYEGGGLNATRIANMHAWKGEVPDGMPEPLGVDESMARWAEHNGCDPEPAEERIGETILHRTWSGCTAATELYVHEGGGHTWPGKPQPAFEEMFGAGTTEIDATELMFDLFFGEPA